MSLKGSLQTVALPEVLQFLSSTGKSGELHVSGAQSEGRLWFDTGRISAFDAGRAAEAFEAVYELLRIEDGEFVFGVGDGIPETAVHDSGDGDVNSAIEGGQARLTEWQGIVAAVPSLAHQLRLVAEGPDEGVMLEPDQWTLIVAVGDGRSVGEVLERAELREFEGCRAVRDVVEAGLVRVSDPVEEAVEAAPAFEPEVVAVVEPAPVDEVDEVVAEADEIDEPVVASEPEAEPETELEAEFVAEAEVVLEAPEPAAEVTLEAPEWTAAPAWSEPSAETWSEAAPEDGTSLDGSMLRFGFEAPAEPASGADEEAAAPSTPAYGSYSFGEEATAEVVGEAAYEDQTSAEDRYAALRAAVMEVHELGDDYDGEEGEAGSAYQLDTEDDGRAALQALLNEVTAPSDGTGQDTQAYEPAYGSEGAWDGDHQVAHVTDDEPVDGLADRGPWTEHELAVMDSDTWSDGGQEESSNIVPFVAPVATDESAEEEEGSEEASSAEEPINRGLLLKFLSSVRN